MCWRLVGRGEALHSCGEFDPAQYAVSITDERVPVLRDPARHRREVARVEFSREHARFQPDRDHGAIRRIHPIAVCHANLNPCIVTRSVARSDPNNHWEAGLPWIQVRHLRGLERFPIRGSVGNTLDSTTLFGRECDHGQENLRPTFVAGIPWPCHRQSRRKLDLPCMWTYVVDWTRLKKSIA